MINTKCVESHMRSYLKAKAYGDEEELPTRQKLNRKSKIQNVLALHPQLLRQIWRKTVKTIGIIALFARLIKLSMKY